MSTSYRYPGIHPFSPQDQALFFGRETDQENLFTAILLNQITVIIGRSGIGKSSLINAGLLPKIEKEVNQKENDKRNFLLLHIRAGNHKNSDDATLLQKILQTKISSIIPTAPAPEPPEVQQQFLPFLRPHQKESLWYKLKQLQYLDLLNQKKRVYLTLIDQLEELFTYPAEEFRTLLTELEQVLSPNPPDRVREGIYEAECKDENILSDKEQRVLEAPIPVKFLFAIRSDKLSLLIRLRDAICNIFQNLYELRPLSRQQAMDAITKPTELKNGFSAPPFRFHEEAVQAIVDYLDQRRNADPELNLEELRIEPFALQIICSHIEQNLSQVDDNHDGLIQKPEVSELDLMIEQFYLDILGKLKLDDQTLLSLKELIEDQMIDEQHRRKRIVYKGEINDPNLDEDLLKKVVDHRLLREVTGLGMAAYEISHDFLIEPILHAKQQRLNASKRLSVSNYSQIEKFDATLAKLQEEIRKNPNEYNNYTRLGDYYYFLQDYEKAIDNYTEAINQKNHSNIKGADLELYFNRGDCYNRLGKYELSTLDFNRVLEIEDKHLLANHYNGFNYQQLGQPEVAARYYTKVLEINDTYVNSQFNLGIVYRQMQKLEESEQCFQKVITLDPKDHEAYYYLGLLSAEKARPDRALEYFNKVLALKPDYADAYIQKALIYAEKNEMENALHCYSSILQFDPQHATAHKSLGIIYRSFLNNIAEAEKHFFEAVKLNKTDHESYYYLGIIANDQKRFEEAIAYFDKSIQLNATYINSYLEKAYALLQLYHDGEALAIYEAVLQIEPGNAHALKGIEVIKGQADSEEQLLSSLVDDPNDISALYTLGVQANNDRQYEKAIDYFQKVLTLKPDHINALIEQAYAYNYLQNDNQAIACYQTILDLHPNNLQAIRSLASVYFAKADYRKAKEYFTQASQIEPENYKNFYSLGLIASYEKEFTAALTFFEQALAISPYQKESLIGQAYVLDQLGRTEESIACYQKIIEIDPAYASAYSSLGILYNKLGKPEEAEKNYLLAVQLNKNDYESYYDLGILADRKKELLQAIQYFEKAIEINPDFTKAYDYLAYYYMQTRDYQRAAALYQKMLEIDPAYSNAYYNMGIINIRLQNAEAAIGNLNKAVTLNPTDYEAYFQMGKLYKQMNMPQQATASFAKAANLNVDYKPAIEQLDALRNTPNSATGSSFL